MGESEKRFHKNFLSVMASMVGMLPGMTDPLMAGGYVPQEGYRRKRRRRTHALKNSKQFRGWTPYIDPIGRFPTVGAWAKAKGLCKR